MKFSTDPKIKTIFWNDGLKKLVLKVNWQPSGGIGGHFPVEYAEYSRKVYFIKKRDFLRGIISKMNQSRHPSQKCTYGQKIAQI
jgi:hypothetical protein